MQHVHWSPKLLTLPPAPQQQKKLTDQEQLIILSHDKTSLTSESSYQRSSKPSIARMYTIRPTCQERGTAFFFSRYVNANENVSHQRFDFLYDIWKPGAPSPGSQADVVMASMAAVGLIGISQLTHSEEIIDSARKSYGTALCLTNAALKDPGEAVKDTTMLSVLILGVYEMMAKPGLETIKTWQDHINGAMELAKLRGVEQFRTRAGVRMFKMLCENVTISCMQRGNPMPSELVALQNVLLSTTLTDHRPDEFDKNNFPKAIYKLLQVRHDMRMTDLRNSIDVLLSRLNELEVELDKPLSTFSADYYFKEYKVTCAHKAVFNDMCHVYPSIAIATACNWLRSGRILVLETILAAVQRLFPEPGEHGELVPADYMATFLQACSRLNHVHSAIIASMPQHFGLLDSVSPCFDSLKPVPTAGLPLLTTKICKLPTPPAQSLISSTEFVQTPSAYSDKIVDARALCFDNETVRDDGGPSLNNPTRACNMEEEAEYFMLLASATNSAVWPLFVVGVGSVCCPLLKEYVAARLDAIFDETGLRQAQSVASIVRKKQTINSPWQKLYTQSDSMA